MKPTTPRAVTCSRNSSARQKSINDQKADNRKACAALCWSVVAEHGEQHQR